MFEGASTLSVDAKGRISIPTRYRDALTGASGGMLHLTRHFNEPCLLLFAEEEWGRFRERVAQWPASDAWAKRRTLGHAVQVEMDAGSGRILIAPDLREAARIGKEAKLLGNGSHFELWDKELYGIKETHAEQEPVSATLAGFVF
ncbi:MAG: division/cell wall cluster transcriptional repressor MraZ [Brachymonas sp.]|nr:division/cell wall cluster transcriptional repressor MraZ [Brachymonas sp.]